MAVERQVELRWGGDGPPVKVPSGLSALCRGRALAVARRGRGATAGAPAGRAGRRLVRGPAVLPWGDVVDLPLGPEEEVDVEGLDRTDGHLWIVGSHSRTRKQVNDGDGADEALDALAKLDVEGIVALDDAVLIGLRGPVLRGWAVALFGGWPAVGHLFARVRR